MERGLFVCFLFIAAGQDLRRQSVEICVYGFFGGMAMLGLIYGQINGQVIPWIDIGSSLCIGLGLLGCHMVWREAIGIGDGCFFLVSGLMLGFWHNLTLLCYGLLLCGVYSLGFLVWNQLCYCKNVRKQTIPFLPFLIPVGIWIALQ